MTTILHAVEMHHWPPGPDAGRRKRAQESGQATLYNRGVVPVHVWEHKRTAREIGDDRDLPFFKDVLSAGMSKVTNGDDIVFWSNDDLVFHPDFLEAMKRHVAIWDVCTRHRCESDQRFSLEATPDEWVAQSRGHIGRDVFAAKALWIHQYWGHLGDWILGAPHFDLHLLAIVRRSKGFITTRQNLETVFPGCELAKGYVGHEAHEHAWGRLPAHTPSHRHNATLFQEWAAKWLPDLWFNPQNGQI
jgi:hypothetical protein